MKKEKDMADKIYIVVSGGVVTGVFGETENEIEIEIIDLDNAKAASPEEAEETERLAEFVSDQYPELY